MATSKKTDNHDMAAKLVLRRHFLRKYHTDQPVHVMDCCQGGGRLWGALRQEFDVASYWGLDLKPKKGRLKIDSVRVLQQPGWMQNCIDVDTYGVPWKHWLALLPNLTRPTTVFLTIGRVGIMGPARASTVEIEAAGAIFHRLPLPASFGRSIAEIAISSLLARGCLDSIITVEAAEAVSAGNARYIGLRLEKHG